MSLLRKIFTRGNRISDAWFFTLYGGSLGAGLAVLDRRLHAPLPVPPISSIQDVKFVESTEDQMKMGTAERAGWIFDEKNKTAMHATEPLLFSLERKIYQKPE